MFSLDLFASPARPVAGRPAFLPVGPSGNRRALRAMDVPPPAPDIVPLPPSPHPVPPSPATPPEIDEPPLPGRAPVSDPLLPGDSGLCAGSRRQGHRPRPQPLQ